MRTAQQLKWLIFQGYNLKFRILGFMIYIKI